MLISPPGLPALPIVLGLGAAVIWGAADFAGGLATRRATPGRVVFVAHGLSLVLLLVLTTLLGSPPLTGRAMLWGLLSGVSGGIALMVFYEALAEGAMGLSAALAGLLTAALPVALSIAEQGWPGHWQLAGFGVAAAAIALIAYAPSSGQAASRRSLVLATFAGCGFGVQLVVLHIASEHGSVVRALMLSRVGGTVTGLVAMLLWRRRGSWGRTVKPAEANATDRTGAPESPVLFGFVVLAVLAGVLDTSGNGLYMAAALAGRLDVAAVLSSLYPGSTILLAAVVLRERTTALQTAGMCLALAAVALISA